MPGGKRVIKRVSDRRTKSKIQPSLHTITTMPTIREDHRREKTRSIMRLPPVAVNTEMMLLPKEKPSRCSRTHSIRRSAPPIVAPTSLRTTPNSLLQVETRAPSQIRLHPAQQIISTQHGDHTAYSCIESVQNSCENTTLPPFTVWKNKNGEFCLFILKMLSKLTSTWSKFKFQVLFLQNSWQEWTVTNKNETKI